MDETHTQLKHQKHGDVLWIDTQSPGQAALSKLEHDFRLHPIHVKESMQKVQHNEIEREENYLFLVLHYPIVNAATGKLAFGQVGIFLGKDFLVTIRTAHSPAIEGCFEECHNEEIGKEAFKKGPGYLLYMVISRLLAEISVMTDGAVDELDEIEDLVFDNSTSDAERIGKARQKIVRLMRIIGPKKLVLRDLEDQIDGFTGQKLAKYYSNNTNTVDRLWEIIEEAKETVEIYKDADFTTSTEQTNEILAVLTILFTFTIPITVVGTIYGMNVPLPGGLATGAWTFLGHYTTFIMLVILSSLLALGMYLYFRHKKWLA
jgi:magnesium transporter